MAGAADSILAAIPPADCYVTQQTHKQTSGCFRHTYILWTYGVKIFCTVLLLLPLFLFFSNFLSILYLPTYITVRASLPLSTHLYPPCFLFLRHFQFLVSPSIYFYSPSPRFSFLFTTFRSVFCFSSSSVFLTLFSYPLIAKFLHLFLSPLLHLILIFFFLRTIATVNFGCSYPYATLNLRLWWRDHWHCLCHIFLFGVLTVSSLFSPKRSDTPSFVAFLPLIKGYIISGSQGGICDIQRMLWTDVRLIKGASTYNNNTCVRRFSWFS